MSVYRIVLLAMIAPCLWAWVSGKAGRKRIADVSLFLYCVWCVLGYTVNNGLASIQSSGIIFIETAGPYLLARCFIRDAVDFSNMIQLQFRIILFLLPFAIVECIIGQNILLKAFAAILATPGADVVEGTRGGLTRVSLVFEHPILFGVYASTVFAPSYLVLGYKDSLVRRYLRTGVVGVTTFTSLSAGPIIVIAVQGFLLFWNSLLRGTKLRWKILIGLLVSLYVSVSSVANRSVLDIATSFFVFDPQSYWFRQVIWQYGSAAAINHPLFGVGQKEWERPDWMGSSIDNFWLSIAVFHGLPAVLLILLSIFSIFLSLGFKRGLDEKLLAYRTSFLIVIVGFCIVQNTVALWDVALATFFFTLGSGVWMLDVKSKR
jgi:O-Antigen ligase